MKWISRLCYWVVAIVFIYAGWVKVIAPDAFLGSVLSYEVFGYTLSVLIALFVPYLEVLAGLALGIGFWRRGAELLIWAMLFVFLILIVQAWVKGLQIDCGCFGSKPGQETPSFLWLTIRDLGLMACLWLAGFCKARLSRESYSLS